MRQGAAVAMLERVRLPDPAGTLARYPHELSGGMRQRVAIALALVARPRVLFADEPTTALDVTVQAEVMALLAELCESLGMALVLVTHDLGVVAALADRIAVMYAGRIVEEGAAPALLANPAHPYTAGLLAAVPTLSGALGRRIADDRRAAARGRARSLRAAGSSHVARAPGSPVASWTRRSRSAARGASPVIFRSDTGERP